MSTRLGNAARFHARRVWLLCVDGADVVLRRRDPLTPPRRMLGADYSEFARIGAEYRRYFIELGGLQPSHSVLDIGCGVGRMAVPLTSYLTDGRYEGFNVARPEVEWCQGHISSRFPSFRFQLVDVRNARYNPSGRIEPSEFRFPYEDASFDFVFATSVFTHMDASAVERYVAEAARVLKPAGRFLATYFLLNARTRALIDAGNSHFSFRFGDGPQHAEDRLSREAAVAFDEPFVRDLYAEHGLSEPAAHYGHWSGREDFLSWQDVAVATRR